MNAEQNPEWHDVEGAVPAVDCHVDVMTSMGVMLDCVFILKTESFVEPVSRRVVRNVRTWRFKQKS